MTKKPYWIAPSILSADFSCLGKEVKDVLLSGADVVHFDVMDNHYVPNLTIGPLVCESLKKYMLKEGLTAPIDVHLMVKPVDSMINDFANAGADIITFHPEASEHIDRSLDLIHSHGCQSGLVFNPASSLSYLDFVMEKIDMILLMSVNPGFGGQKFIEATLKKIKFCRERIDAGNHAIRLEVDGGIKAENLAQVAAAGCDVFVSGSGIFSNASATDANRYDSIIAQMREILT